MRQKIGVLLALVEEFSDRTLSNDTLPYVLLTATWALIGFVVALAVCG